MKKSVYAAFMIAALGLTACGGDAPAEENEEVVEAVTYSLDAASSSIEWTGSWVVPSEEGMNIAKTHEGSVVFTNGSVTVEGDAITGTFSVDMASITVTDIGEDEGKGSLESHLKGEREGADNHFFQVGKFAQTTVTISEITDGVAKMVMTVLGSDIELSAPMTVKQDGENLMINGEFSVDFSLVGIEGVQPNPEKPEAGNVNPVVDFKVNAVLKK
jgi:hypothetical protein